MSYRLPADLKAYGKKVHSQNDEDGIIECIFSHIPPRTRYYVEFGVGPNWLDRDYKNGIEANCEYLKKQGWNGLMMDGGNHPEMYGIKREFVTASQINSLFRKYNVPRDLDIVSIDVDGQDLWILMALDYRPVLFIVEYNPNFMALHQSVSVVFDQNFRWDGLKYYGASLGAIVKVAADKGYKMVYSNGTNAFFVDSELLANPEDFVDEAIAVSVDQHHADHFQRAWVHI